MKQLNIKKKFESIDTQKCNQVRLKYFNVPMSLSELIEILKTQCGFYKCTVPKELYLRFGLIREGNDHQYRFSEEPWNYNQLKSTMELIYKYQREVKENQKGKTEMRIEEAIKLLKSIKNEDGSDVYVIKKYVPAKYEEI